MMADGKRNRPGDDGAASVSMAGGPDPRQDTARGQHDRGRAEPTRTSRAGIKASSLESPNAAGKTQEFSEGLGWRLEMNLSPSEFGGLDRRTTSVLVGPSRPGESPWSLR